MTALKGYWTKGWAIDFDAPVAGLAVWWARQHDGGIWVNLILGPWYVGYRFFKATR